MGAGIRVAEEAGNVVLLRDDPLDVVRLIDLSRAGVRKMKQNFGWAAGYNLIAIPIAAGILAPWGITIRPEISALVMSASSIIVVLNALALARWRG